MNQPYSIPVRDQRYADAGRREITVGGRRVGASCTPLKPEDAGRFGASHQIVFPTAKGVRPGMVVDFDGTPYRVKLVTDARQGDPAMRGRYTRLICTPEAPGPTAAPLPPDPAD